MYDKAPPGVDDGSCGKFRLFAHGSLPWRRCGGAKTARHSGCGGTDNLYGAHAYCFAGGLQGVYKKVKRNDFKQNIRCRRCNACMDCGGRTEKAHNAGMY